MPFLQRYYTLTYLQILLFAGTLLSFTVRYDEDATAPDLHLIRKQLVTALESKKTTDSLYKSLDAIKNRPAIITGYIGTLEALKAKHAWNPYYKIKYLNDSEKTFKKAVTADPHNIEIRFMRFSIEHNVPKFLGYTKNLIADREEMIMQIDKNHYASADKTLVKTIIKFILETKRCTADEQKRLIHHLAAL